MTERCLHSRYKAGGWTIDEHQEALDLWDELARQFGVLLDVTRNRDGNLISPKRDSGIAETPLKPAPASPIRRRDKAVEGEDL